MVKNFPENKYVEVSFKLPYKSAEPVGVYENPIGYQMDVIGSFSKHLINALEARMNACVNNLVSHKDDIIANNGVSIVYRRNDGTTNSFNLPSIEAMKDGIKMLKMSEYHSFIERKDCVAQAIKGLFWIDRPEDKKGAFKYSDLISVLMTILEV